MKTFTIGWLNKCRCGNKSHTVKTARGNETALWDDDAVKCNSCGRGGVIQVCEGQARVLWETDQEMAEGKSMSTITREFTKEQLQQVIETDHVQCGEASALARIALASLEAEPVAWRCGSIVTVNKPVADDWKRRGFDFHPLYAAPPAPASVPDIKWPEEKFCPAEYAGSQLWEETEIWNKAIDACKEACRAVMLQGADGNSPAHSGCRPAQNCISPAQCGNSPEIPDGWVMLPAEPTQAMMNAWLSEVANWRGHAAGYRAMIAAAPQQEAQ